jgi:hypothetical protein
VEARDDDEADVGPETVRRGVAAPNVAERVSPAPKEAMRLESFDGLLDD